MSTKNLARTIIEGGRYRGNKWDRRNSHAEQRAEVRNYIKELLADPELYFEKDVEPPQHVSKGFRDKLGPIYRWLRRQVGRPWDDVRADVAASFDTRTTAGRHIVYDHLLSSVQINPEVRYRYYAPEDPYTSYSDNDFYVDEAGILCKKRKIPRRHYAGAVPACDTNRITNWLNGRIVGKVGNKLFWFTPADKNKKRGGYRHDWRIIWGYDYYRGRDFRFQYLAYTIIYERDALGKYVLDDSGKAIEIDRVPQWTNATPFGLRQDRKLNEKEMVFWNSLPEYFQNKILELSPTHPKEDKPKYY
jgi:hypothetical protein